MDLVKGSKIAFSYKGDRFQGTVSDVVPLEEGNKYVVEQPIRVRDQKTFSTLWLYDEDEDDFQILKEKLCQ